jgi:thiol-disulfide isomerase/thioredoxin
MRTLRRRASARAPATVLAAGLAAALATALSACSDSSSLDTGGKGYVSGDGTVTVVDAADRRAPLVKVGGGTVAHDTVALSQLRGKVVVMPVWGSWCAPCRAEAPALADAARDLADEGVAFLGINTRDVARDSAVTFVRRFDLPYDSLYDPDGKVLLAFHGTLSPSTIPSFVVIDRKGRIAGRILGEATTATLYGVVEDVLGHPLPEGGSGATSADAQGTAS